MVQYYTTIIFNNFPNICYFSCQKVKMSHNYFNMIHYLLCKKVVMKLSEYIVKIKEAIERIRIVSGLQSSEINHSQIF